MCDQALDCGARDLPAVLVYSFKLVIIFGYLLLIFAHLAWLLSKPETRRTRLLLQVSLILLCTFGNLFIIPISQNILQLRRLYPLQRFSLFRVPEYLSRHLPERSSGLYVELGINLPSSQR